MNRCKVAKYYGIWYAIEHRWNHCKSFPTWAEAMAYAHRGNQTQTITIKDPSGQFGDLTAINKREYVHLKSSGNTFTLAPHEWKPLAHFLLEGNNRMEQA